MSTMSNSGINQRVSISSRLERLPHSSYLITLCWILLMSILAATFINNGFQYLMPGLKEYLNIDPAVLGSLASLAFAGMFFGAMIGGHLADRIGRKPVIIGSMIIWGVAGVMLTYADSVLQVQVSRFFIGLGLGTHLPTAAVLLSEMVPSRLRGKYLVGYIATMAFGMSLVGFTTYFLLPKWGWQGAGMLDALCAVWAIILWKFMPESALWLDAAGRHSEADKIMDKIESAIQKRTGQPLPQPVEVKPVSISAEKVEESKSLWTKAYIGLVLMMTVYMLCQMMGNYGISMWLSSMLVMKGFTMMKSVLYVAWLSLGGVPALFLLGYLVDKIGRKWTVILMAIMTAIFAFIYGQAATYTMVVITGAVYMFMQTGYNMSSMVFTTEVWPTSVRGMGKGYSQACGRVGAFFGPLVAGYIVAAGFGSNGIIIFAVVVNITAAIVIYLFAPETKGKVF